MEKQYIQFTCGMIAYDRTLSHYKKLQEAVNVVSDIINKKKNDCNEYLTKQIPKLHWSILKTFYNGKKILIIRILLMNNEVVSDFKARSNLLNVFFALQCTSLKNSSCLLVSQ